MLVICAIGVFFVVFYTVVIIVMKAGGPKVKKAKQKFGKDEFLFMGTFPILAGLHLPETAKCNVYCLRNRIVIEALRQEYSLPVNRIVDVSTMSKTQIQKQYVSNAGGAVAGGMMFGPLGALLGGGVSQRTIRNTSKFLIFTYKDTDGENMKYIIFDATKGMSKALDFVNAFNGLKRRENIKIDL